MKKKIRWKQGLALLLGVCMAVGILPLPVNAEPASEAGLQTEAVVSENAVQEPEENETALSAEEPAAETDTGNNEQSEENAAEKESSDVYELTLENGAYYDRQHVKYTLQADGTATVAGYDTSYVTDTNFPTDKVEAGEGWEITIPAKVSFDGTEYGVTKVTDSAFNDCIQLTKVDFPNDSVLTMLDMWSFRNCSLKSVRLPDSLTTMGDTVFREDTKLEYIYIPKNVKTIGNGICYGCTALTRIEVSTENSTFYTKSDALNCIIKNNEVIQGCSTSVLPKDVDYLRINYYAFAGIDATNIDFSNVTSIKNFAFIDAKLPEGWIHLNSNCYIEQLAFYRCTTLKRATIPENTCIMKSNYVKYSDDSQNYTGSYGSYAYGSSIFSRCDNLEKVVIPKSLSFEPGFTDKITNYDFFRGCNSDNLTAYVEDGANDYLMTALKNYAKEDWTGGKTTPTTNENGHFVLKDAYRVQLAEKYEGYTLVKAKDCATLVPIPGDSATFTITATDGYKAKPVVKVGKPGLTADELAALIPVSYDEAKGGYTITVDADNYVVYLENYGECSHSGTFTYIPGSDEAGNAILTKKCNDCGEEESGKVTAVWRHGSRRADHVVFSCDNADLKGSFAIADSEKVTDGNDTYRYVFKPADGTYAGNGRITVKTLKEEKVSTTADGITYTTVRSADDINAPIGNCPVDICYDSEASVLYIIGSETYVLSGESAADRIIVNNTEPVTLVLNELTVQEDTLPAIDLQGTADVKLILADGTKNYLECSGWDSDAAALQKNDLASGTPELAIYGPGMLSTFTFGKGAGIGGEAGKTASNISFHNAKIKVWANGGCGIGAGAGTVITEAAFSAEDFAFDGGYVEVEAVNEENKVLDISGGMTLKNGAVYRGLNYYGISSDREKIGAYTAVEDGFVTREYRSADIYYQKMNGNIILDGIYEVYQLEVPKGATLTVAPWSSMYIEEEEDLSGMTNNGTFVIKGTVSIPGKIKNTGIIYNYNAESIRDNVENSGSGTLHEDINKDGLCDICSEDISNVSVTDYTGKVTVERNDKLTLSATVTPKTMGDGKNVTYQWYESGADGAYTAIDGATAAEYVQESCMLSAGEYTYRLQIDCDGIKRNLPFAVKVVTAHQLTAVSAKAATAAEAGNKAYFVCDICGRYFEDSKGTKEITDKNSVVIPATGMKPSQTPEATDTPTVAPTAEPKGTKLKDGTGAAYKVTSEKGKTPTVQYLAPKSSAKGTVTVPAAVTIDGVAYKVTSIADNAFKGNKKIKKLVIGSSITSIGKNAFAGCKNLTSITIGKNVKKIGKNAFSGCKKLKSIIIKTKKLTNKSVAKKAFNGISKKVVVKVPKSKYKNYKKLLRTKGLKKATKIRK